MKIKNNKSVYLIFDAIKCTPNGDPDTNMQRLTPDNNYAKISDVRIKRHARNKFIELGEEVYIEYESVKKSVKVKDSEDASKAKKESGSAAKINLLIKKYPNIPVKEVLLKCIDTRLFGGIGTVKNSEPIHITGALQFSNETISLNRVNLTQRSITSSFPSSSKNTQGTFGSDSFIDYGIFSVFGKLNAKAADENNLTETDFKKFLFCVFDELNKISTRTKNGQNPLMFIVVNHKTYDNLTGPTMDWNFKPISIKELEKTIESRDDIEVDFKNILTKLNDESIESIDLYYAKSDFPTDLKVNNLNELLSSEKVKVHDVYNELLPDIL